ncbi:MAG: lamin tail domain-containing protein, partial [Caldilineaceae bacterium]|nr:lamin tail domain-containing protein [Caldilineaceae bacterium]
MDWEKARAQSPSMRISQIYGGGGNSGATLNSDFIELFNASAAPVDLAGWSVQYAAADGTNWQVTPLSGRVAPGGYLLIKQASGTGGSDAGTALETPNVVGAITMSATKGKVALVSSTNPINGSGDANVVDFVGYGAATEFEGGGAAGGAANSAAVFRSGNGCIDTDQNQSDFSGGAPQP